MIAVYVVLRTSAVLFSWLGIAVMCAGCGSLARRGLLRLWPAEPRAERLAVADVWIGLAALVAYLEVWNLFLSVTWAAWVAPIATGFVGVVVAARRVPRFRHGRIPIAVCSLLGLATLWLANRALAAAHDYDLGLYHLGAIDYALRYHTIPGLANLQIRLGASNAHLLFVSFLERGPWSSAGLHLANGLLAALLFMDVGSRFVFRPTNGTARRSFTNRLAILLVPATAIVIAAAASDRLSSPSLDLPTFVFVAVGMLYLAECVETGFGPTSVVAATALLALGSATRPLYWPVTGIAVGLVVFGLARRYAFAGRRVVVGSCLACVLPSALLGGWMIRQAILSGYPFFPTTVFALPVDWRVPRAAVRTENDWIAAWARSPGHPPAEVLGSWHWFTSWWLRARLRSTDVGAPLALLACVIPSLAVWRGDSSRRQRLLPMLAVVLPSFAVLIGWFVTAPDPRFVFAPIWLIPAALVAWALPTRANQSQLTTSGALKSLLPSAAVVAAMLAVIAHLAGAGRLDPIVPNKAGPLGVDPPRKPAVRPVQTRSGLRLVRPVDSDQCWGVLLCTSIPDARLRLRGSTVAEGFTVRPASSRR